METSARPALAQPVTGLVTSLLGLGALVAVWIGVPFSTTLMAGLTTTLVAIGLVVSVILAANFPIHVRYRQKIEINSAPLYLMAVLLPPALAVTAAGLAILTAELVVRGRRGTYPSDIATQVGRMLIVTLACTLVAHIPIGPGAAQLALLAGAAVTMWIVDLLTGPFLIQPLTGEPFLQIIRASVREAAPAEAAQYIVGLLGALAAAQQIWALPLLILPTALVYLAFKNAKEMHDSTRQLLESMADTVDLRDPYTGGHSRRVTELCAGILREMEISSPDTAVILAAARVHDIGKIGIPDQVLHKTGPLTPEERAIMETHPERGADLLGRYPDFARGVVMVRHHHEWWNGNGYPHRLKGTEIPLGARLISVADSFDAMTTDRPYRRAMSARKAAEILRAGRGIQWDAAIVDTFLHSIADQLEPAAPARLKIVGDSAPEGYRDGS